MEYQVKIEGLSALETQNKKRIKMNKSAKTFLGLLLAGLSGSPLPATPEVHNLNLSILPGTGLVNVSYDLAGEDASIVLAVADEGGAPCPLPVKAVKGAVGDSIKPGPGKTIVWDASADWPGKDPSTIRVEVRAWNLRQEAEHTFVKIPSGTYQVGNLSGDSDIVDAPGTEVCLGRYYMAANLTTKAQWDRVWEWAAGNGYPDLAHGGGKAEEHPVQGVSWFDVVKWSNAASEKEGLAPCYRVDGQVLRAGTPLGVTCDWRANGYRLPTEAEWEVAARGGLKGNRFPWGNTISHEEANYFGAVHLEYDGSAVRSFHPASLNGGSPHTTPVGSFPPNGYGLYDMGGNVCQWCWDWYGDYRGGTSPVGGRVGSERVVRGGFWFHYADYVRCAYRGHSSPATANENVGFRLVRGRP